MTLDIHQESDVFDITYIVKNEALKIGFESYDAALLSMAVSELATNVVRYARHGVVIISPSDNHKGLEIQVNDKGTGIDNIELAQEDHYSSTNSLGLGLGAAKRSVDEMLINNTSNGCNITLKKYLPVPRENIDTGMVSFPKVGSHINGDAYFVKDYQGDKILLAILDGAGSGLKAQQSTEVIKEYFKQHYTLPLDQLIHNSHQLIINSHLSRGVEIAIMRITPSKVEAVIMGNTCIHVNAQPYNSIPVQNGSIGLSVPANIHVHCFDRPQQFCFVMHSDGINNIDYENVFSSPLSAQKQAEKIFDAHARADDDASIIVVQG